jgi:uncharacterized protein
MKKVLIFFVRVYQVVISPPLHFIAGPLGGCRYFPTCSQYFIDAVTVNGPIKGAWQGFLRILRCNPFGGQGYDPPPGWEEYVAKHPETAYVGRRGCDIDHSKISEPKESIEDPRS